MAGSAPRLLRIVVVLAVGAAVWGCSSRPEASHRRSSSPAAVSPSHPSTPSTGATASSRPHPTTPGRAGPVTKLLVVVEENHSLSQTRTGMPYAFALARRFGYATDYHAVTHPSLPNYLAIASGSTHGVSDDDPPSAHPLPGRTVFGQALARGGTAGVYADAMPGDCVTQAQGTYAVKHNPWAYFPGERRGCLAHDLPLDRLWAAVRLGRLPNAGMVVPDICHDAHSCSLAVADGWLRRLMSKIFQGPDWTSGRLAVVVTADEDDGSEGNTVLTVVVHPSQRHHVVSERLDHYSLTRLYEDVTGVPYLGAARTAPSMAAAFGLPLR